jgi:hypothetical protein
MAKHRDYHLTARQDFGAYKRGDHIEEADEVERILGSEHAAHVVRVPADSEPAAQDPAPGAAPNAAAATATEGPL